ncbi:hypothetical protein Tsubulata_034306 [Turnera subulata]|uniref:BHLH domain-containing protein n=1 Tax=Turnera subulata TaxID=218843 RepID=A0A9Q0J465_9ROSI|nr:hypothetical protein Tsubulata_034306 [Turnera subulata]
MGEDCGPWFPQQPLHWQLANLNSGIPLHLGQQNIMNPGGDMGTASGALPLQPHSGLPRPQVNQANEPHGWLYCLPRFRQAFAPALNSAFEEKLPMAPSGCHKEALTPKAVPGCGQKRFLVFDQSGDQTTLIFSAGIGTPVQRFTSWSPKPSAGYDWNGEYPVTRDNLNPNVIPLAADDELGENNGTDSHSEMHEDTEELNALLYSDSDYDSDYTDENDEVTSTGHSPSTMTAQYKQDGFDMEEVASSGGSCRKRKLFDGGYCDELSLVDTASSAKHFRSLDYDDDAESKCINGTRSLSGEMGPHSDDLRIRKGRIRETVSILQNIIPGGKGKDALVVLDEAIDYLKSLKLKAKALGLDAPNVAV